MKKIIVTGASGFLGNCLIEHILSKPKYYKLYALTGKEDALKYKYRTSRIVVLNRNSIFDKKSEYVKDLIKDSYIVNCAFPRNTVGLQFAEGLDYISGLFNIARTFRAKAIINISSQSVYSQKRNKIANEATPIELESIYATGKYAVELLLESICKDMIHTNLRISSLIGARFDQRVTNKMIDDAIYNKQIKVINNQKIFGYMDVDDAAEAVIALLETNTIYWEPIYTVGVGCGYKLIDISKLIVDLSNKLMNVAVEVKIKEEEDFGNTSVSCDLFSKHTGFHCSFSLEDSLRRIFEFKLKKKV